MTPHTAATFLAIWADVCWDVWLACCGLGGARTVRRQRGGQE
jgi:hypothetical protein